MFRLSIRNLLAHKARVAMTSFAVILGVSFVVGSLVVTDTVRGSFDTLFEEITEGVDLEVRSEAAFSDSDPGTTDREPVDASLADAIAGIDGVAAVDGGVEGLAQPVAPDGDAVSTMGAPLLGFSWGDADDLVPFELSSGEKPEVGEIALDQSTFDEYDFSLGDEVDVLLPGGTETFTLVGTATFGDTNSLAGARVTLFEPADAQRVFDREGLWDVIDIALVDGADVEAVQAEIAALVPDGVEVVTGETLAEEGSDAVGAFIDVFGNVLLGFAAVALFVSAFYIYNTFSIILGQRVRELALLRAIGAGAAQIRRTVIVESLLIGVASSIIGLGTGMVTALGLRGVLNSAGMGIPADALVLEPRTVVAAAVVGIGVTLFASYLPARNAATVAPVAALREDPGSTQGSHRLRLIAGATSTAIGAVLLGVGLVAADGAAAVITSLGIGAVLVFLGVAGLSPLFAGPVARALGAPVERLFGEAGKLARENAARNPYRTATTAAALLIGLALVTMASIVGASVKDTFAETTEQAVSADFVISEPSFSGFSPTLAESLEAQPELDAVSGIRFGRFQIDGNTRDVVSVGPAGGDVVDIDLLEGSGVDELSLGEILLFEDPARDLGLAPGDTVTVGFSRTGEQELTVAGIYGDATFAGNYLVSHETWEANFTDSIDSIVFARAADGVSSEAAAAAVASATADFPQAEVEDRQEFLASQQAQVDQILAVINALLMLAVIIAVLGIGNTLALSVFERTRELGLLRAVGMSRRQTRRMVRWEAAIVSLFGAVMGVVVGTGFGLAATASMPDSVISTVTFPVATLVTLLVVAVVAGLLAAIMPARRAARLDVLDAIATA